MKSINELRKMTGLSQSKFANLFNIPVSNLQHWEQGVSSPPGYVNLLIERVIIAENLLKTED